MQRKRQLLKIEKYFEKSKMDKKNVQKMVAENVLTDEKFCLDKKSYRHKLNPNKIFCYDIF